MIWQDIVLMLGGFTFTVAPIPTLKSVSKPPRSTCAITAGVLAAYCVAYASLGLWFAFSAAMLTKGVWLTILLQRRR